MNFLIFFLIFFLCLIAVIDYTVGNSYRVKGYDKVLNVFKNRKITQVVVYEEHLDYVCIHFDGSYLHNALIGLKQRSFFSLLTHDICFRISSYSDSKRELKYAVHDLNGATTSNKRHVVRAFKECGIYDIINEEIVKKTKKNF